MMRLWQARKEKSQKIRKVEGRILYIEMDLQCLLGGGIRPLYYLPYSLLFLKFSDLL